MSTWTLSGKVILVTGGAAGIGAATAAELARRGARPVLADLDREAAEATARTIGSGAVAVELDVTDAEACERAVAETVEREGALDAVWANAGIASFGPLAQTDPTAWERTIEVNLLGVFRTIRAALPEVVARRGYVAVTASLASFAHPPGMSAYSASKAGVEALANALRVEVAHLGVDVGTIHPTWIATNMVNEADAESRAFAVLRKAMAPPFNKTYSVEGTAREIADGFEHRARRICTPSFVRAAHVLRAALTTRAFEWNLRRAAPEITATFNEEVAERGVAAASSTHRTHRQLERSAAR